MSPRVAVILIPFFRIAIEQVLTPKIQAPRGLLHHYHKKTRRCPVKMYWKKQPGSSQNLPNAITIKGLKATSLTSGKASVKVASSFSHPCLL
jgi:hypothetical protein